MIQHQATDFEEPCNNIVAQSDYEAALAAIESTFESFRLSQQQSQENEQSLDQELIAEIYRTAKISLLNNVKRVVRPIDDNDYNDYVDQYHFVLDEESDSDENDMDSDPNTEDESDDKEEEEIDLEELVDMKAWKDAQRLRTRIREMSNKVQTVRERVLKRTEDGILSSISENLVDKPVIIVFEEADGNDASDDKENSGRNSNIALQNSLRDLSKALKDPKWTRLPNRIQSLQNTIETVQKETSEDRVMSQTEIAILSQPKATIDESRRRMLEDDSGNDENASNYNTANAMDRLALFGQLFA
mmetsp:Transcript_7784/g.19057  ORF Transcript_7784/g.19057 Transcript_7784/m.19057 type:complete len:302 (-) Transcript_7784:180-1085(-)